MQTVFIECACRKTAKRRAPWAAVIIKVSGGFQAFECQRDAEVWKRQK